MVGRIWAAAQKTLGSRSGTHEHEIGEAQVGQQLPLRDQQPQPLVVIVGEVGMPGDDLRHRWHGTTLIRGPREVRPAAQLRARELRAAQFP